MSVVDWQPLNLYGRAKDNYLYNTLTKDGGQWGDTQVPDKNPNFFSPINLQMMDLHTRIRNSILEVSVHGVYRLVHKLA